MNALEGADSQVQSPNPITAGEMPCAAATHLWAPHALATNTDHFDGANTPLPRYPPTHRRDSPTPMTTDSRLPQPPPTDSCADGCMRLATPTIHGYASSSARTQAVKMRPTIYTGNIGVCSDSKCLPHPPVKLEALLTRERENRERNRLVRRATMGVSSAPHADAKRTRENPAFGNRVSPCDDWGKATGPAGVPQGLCLQG